MTESEKLALKSFLLGISCLKKLDKWTDNFNLFDVLKITNMEIRHSNILAWFFDPNENHAMGDAFIREFIRRIAVKNQQDHLNYFDLLLQDFYSYQVYRESNHMDIVLYSRTEQTAIIIENKIWSGESQHQLHDYVEKSQIAYADCKQILYVFLTPDGYPASDPERWISFSYEEIVESLECAAEDQQLRGEVALILKNYIETVRKNIMKEKDEELIRICNEIYNQHRTALRLIFENVRMDDSVESEVICEALQELNDEGLIRYHGDHKWSFGTTAMDQFLPPLDAPVSSWGTNYIYWYWFEKSDECLILHFEIGGENLTVERAQHADSLIVAAGKETKDHYRFKRLYYAKEKLSQDDYETSLKNAVKKLVQSALKHEKILLDKAIAKIED